MKSETSAFFTLWLNRLVDALEIRLLPSRKQLWSRDIEEIGRFIDDATAATEHIYFGVLGRATKNGGKSAIREAHCLWADIDFKDLADGQAEADVMIAMFDHPPTLRVESGGGYHLYWFFNEPSTDLARVERILKGLVPRLKADIKSAEIARILRPPGTTNWKYDPAIQVKATTFDLERVYGLDDFAEWEMKEEQKLVEIPTNGEFEERFDLKAYLKYYRVQLDRIKKQDTATFFCLKKCLFDDGHTVPGQTNDAAIVQQETGMLSYQCFHVSCSDKMWSDARAKISGKDHLTPFIGRNIKPLIERYVLRATGQFSIGGLTSWLDIKTMQEREITATIIESMEKDRIITRTGNKHGIYRPVDRNPHIMNIGVTRREPLKIVLPLELHTLVKLYPKNVVIVAGEKDAGKTAFSMNAAYMNRDIIPVRYINSEMGEEELEARLAGFPDQRISEWRKITWIEQSSKFEDAIDPDGFNIIDFLEIGADAYAVVEDIKRVFDRLQKGLLLIIMQKRSYKDFAVGGEGTLEKARLAVNLERRQGKGNVCRITVAKNWTGKIRNPRGYECLYKIYAGGEMKIEGEWYDPAGLAEVEGAGKDRGMKRKKDYKAVYDQRFVHEED